MREPSSPRPEVLVRQAKDTLTAVEMNRGDTLKFTLRNGRTRTLVLDDTSAQFVERVPHGGVVYCFSCRVRIDGHPVELLRYVGTQESFYEPMVINGMRIWLDAVLDIFELVPMRKIELLRVPHKQCRLAVQDAALPICPQEMRAWYRNEGRFIDIADCYNGDDCWLGAYIGRACHGGLDINHPKGDPLWAPIDFDDQWLFNSLAAGHNNNRWRGVRKWPNGETWALQTHHIIKLLVPEHTPLKAGTHYATAAGVHVGSHNHTHFVFKVTPSKGGPEIHLDPWVLFWQIFETSKANCGAIRAAMRPLSPARTGETVSFSSEGSRSGRGGGTLATCWAFGDGGWSDEPSPSHTFARPGVYAVTLVVDDGVHRASHTQLLTVDGEAAAAPALALAAPDEPAFRLRPPHVLDVHGWPVKLVPHTLRFVARATRPVPNAKAVGLRNLGGGTLPKASRPAIRHAEGGRWLSVAAGGEGNGQALSVTVDAGGLEPGRYVARVSVDCPGAVNSPQGFRVVLEVPKTPPATELTVDDRDAGFCCTPYFWVGHRFCRNKGLGWHKMRKGLGDFYLTNGGRATAGEFVRFTPDLAAGRYEVSFSPECPFRRDSQLNVRVRRRAGDTVVRVKPAASRVIGAFDFAEGADGFVELLGEGSAGLVVADAVTFRRLAASGPRANPKPPAE